jgi:hypothetical protein
MSTCGTVARGAQEPCPLPAGHQGYHADPRATFTCDGCGQVRRGQPDQVGPNDTPYEGIALCFLCTRPMPPRYEDDGL